MLINTTIVIWTRAEMLKLKDVNQTPVIPRQLGKKTKMIRIDCTLEEIGGNGGTASLEGR